MDLIKQKCIPCEGGTLPLNPEEIKNYMSYLKTPWEVVGDKKIKKEFKFKDFKETMKFVNRVADIAESEGHHPNIYIFYNKVSLELSTHAIKGLSTNDFIIASKAEKLHSYGK